MVKQVAYSKRKIIVFAVLAAVVAAFSIGIIVQRGIRLQAQEQADKMAKNISESNIDAIDGFLNRYTSYIADIKSIATANLSDNERLTKLFQHLTSSDSSIIRVWITSHRVKNRFDTLEIAAFDTVVEKDTIPHLLITYEIPESKNQKKEFGLAVDLLKMHQQLSLSKSLRNAYVTLTAPNGILLYHPNEKLIGKYDTELTLHASDTIQGKLEREFQSSYLDLKVHRYIKSIPFAKSHIWVTVNVPNLDFVDFVHQTQLNLWLMIVTPLLILLLVIGVGVWIWKGELISRKKAEQEALRLQLLNAQQQRQMVISELENLKSGVNPHFLFNSLSSLKALIKRNPIDAINFSQALSNMYRFLLESEHKNTVLLADEMAFTNSYISIQKIRFKEALSISIDIENIDQLSVPPLAVQTLVENSIKHNIASISTPLAIQIFTQNGYLHVVNNLNRRTSIVESTGKGQYNLVRRYSYLTTKACLFKAEAERYIASIPLLEA